MSQRRDRITDQAAQWLVRAQEPDFSTAEKEEFASWLAGSAENVLEYLSLTAISHDVRDASAGIDVDALVALAREASDPQNVVTIGPHGLETPAEPANPSTRKDRRTGWVIAASLAMAFLATVLVLLSSGPAVHSTGLGEQSSFALEDGSVVNLNAQSSVETHYSESERIVRLLAGEALFDIEADPERPFRVITEQAIVRAVGTSFNVRQRGEATTVTVVEGSVDVRPRNVPQSRGETSANQGDGATGTKGTANNGVPVLLKAGQQALIHRQTADIVIVDANLENATSWRARRLIFDSWPLSEVVAEFRLYDDYGVVIEDEELSSTLISGAFDADDFRSFGLFLSKSGIATVNTRANGVFVLRLPPDER